MKVGDLVECLWENHYGIIVYVESQWKSPVYTVYWSHSGLRSRRWDDDIGLPDESR